MPGRKLGGVGGLAEHEKLRPRWQRMERRVHREWERVLVSGKAGRVAAGAKSTSSCVVRHRGEGFAQSVGTVGPGWLGRGGCTAPLQERTPLPRRPLMPDQ